MYALYKLLTYPSGYFLTLLLKWRCKSNKESPSRFIEKKAVIVKARPKGKLLWIHGASLGEAQSALILIEHILKTAPNIHILVTTGTLTSAKLMEQHLPNRAFHQFYPLDHIKWVQRFLDHWHPNAIIWMESELWPNMLHQIKKRNITAALINARMSPKSFKSWRHLSSIIKPMLGVFDKILCQTDKDKALFDRLGAHNTITTDNLKYSAQPLSFDQSDLNDLHKKCKNRSVWLYASTHDGEEQIAHKIHSKLKNKIPNLLTIIVPRHPERSDDIQKNCVAFGLKTTYRGQSNKLPQEGDDIYVADTLGELGLFYKLSSIACIGRSLSYDGGGGHNPIEAAQLDCAVIHGSNIQNLQQIYDEMDKQSAAICVETPDELYDILKTLFENSDALLELQQKAQVFSKRKAGVIDTVIKEIEPIISVLLDKDGTSNLEKTKYYASQNT